MSERGSFVTEYIYCDRCLEAVKSVLLRDEKNLCTRQLPSWHGEGKFLPIIAGKVGGLFAGEEAHTFEFEFIPKLEEVICHPLRIAVLPEDERANRIFTVRPRGAES